MLHMHITPATHVAAITQRNRQAYQYERDQVDVDLQFCGLQPIYIAMSPDRQALIHGPSVDDGKVHHGNTHCEYTLRTQPRHGRHKPLQPQSAYAESHALVQLRCVHSYTLPNTHVCPPATAANTCAVRLVAANCTRRAAATSAHGAAAAAATPMW